MGPATFSVDPPAMKTIYVDHLKSTFVFLTDIETVKVINKTKRNVSVQRNKQRNKQTSKQTSKQTNKKTSKQTSKQTNKQKQTSKQTNKQASK